MLVPRLTFAQEANPSLPSSATKIDENILTRSTLTDDWAGARSLLAGYGFKFDPEFTQFYQGMFAGTGPSSFEYAGRFDGFIDVDSSKLGLWEGGGLHTHMEYRYGESDAFRGGAFLPVNTAEVLPLGASKEFVVTSIYLTQRFGELGSLLLGKINVVDLLAADPFFGGWGILRFMNVAFVAPPTGVLPPVIYGGIVTVKTLPIKWTFMAYDPNDRTREYWPKGLFSDGITFSLSASIAGKVAGRTTSFAVTGTYSTKAETNLSEVLLPDDLRTDKKKGFYCVSFQLNHFLYESTAHPGTGWGLFAKGGLTDGNPNPIQSFCTGGLGGQGLIPGREQDGFGVGYFYYKFSDDLQEAVRPFIEFRDEQGLEVFYNCALTSWLHLTADLQVIRPADPTRDNAVVAGIRTNIRF